MILPPRNHLTMSGDISDGHHFGGTGGGDTLLLASSMLRPWMLPTIHRAASRSNKELSNHKFK